MTNINFTGLRNIETYQKSKLISSLFSGEAIRQTDTVISAELFDDVNGKDFNEYLRLLSRSRPCYQYNCINRSNPHKVEIFCSHLRGEGSNSLPDGNYANCFKLNNYDVLLDERQALSMFTILGKISAKIAADKTLPAENRKMAQFVNDKITESVTHFIDTMI